MSSCVGVRTAGAPRRLSTTTNPNRIHDLPAKLDSQGWYTDDDVDRVAEAQFMSRPGSKNPVLSAAFRNQADQRPMVDYLFSD